LRLDSYLSSKEETRGESPQEENGRNYLGRIKEICQKNSIPLFVIVFPYLKPMDEYKNYQLQEYKNICKIIKELKIEYLNLYEYLPKDNLYNLRERKEDEIHPSREGYCLIAKIVYDYLLGSYSIKK
jgi:lysophospholipase L1-like esterase